ncbi:54K polar flagellar sheath protein A [Vibrio navarrensis]|uniref:54K polar flagellar sheath protein A n=1 Tax=Vibrio navarrensis TaxID=29495 RepID=UPI0018674DCF|nr:54K polar flagellar sheath protein A [Vibrio navarrensis]MBE3666173.1 54K polar flagellar sheath protein A [Vibrio navarrensis]
MKNLKLLPLVAMISGVLVGCGGGGGGGGGGGTASKTEFTFVFAIPATMTKNEATAKGCTVYEYRTDLNDDEEVLTYSAASKEQVTNNIIGYYSDADGKRSGDIIKPTVDNFKFYLEDIPDGGFVTFQALEFGGREARVNTFSKDFLQDKKLRNTTFALNRDSLNKCFTGGNLESTKFTSLEYRNAESGGGDYNFVSQTDVFTSPNPDMLPTDELVGIKGEPTALFQYGSGSNNKELYQYGIGSWGKDEIELVRTDNRSSIYSSSDYTYDSLHIGFVTNGFAYDALELDKTAAEYNRPSSTNKETWAYMAFSENQTNGWITLLNETVSDGWDIDVDPSSYLNLDNLPNTKPSVSTQGSVESVIELGMGLTSSTEGFTRVAYFTSSGNYKITHRIFTKSGSDSVVVPELHYYNFPASAVANLKVADSADFNRATLVMSDDSNIDSKIFMSFFSNGEDLEPELDRDLDGIITSEKEALENVAKLRTSNLLVVSRFN